MCQVIGNLSFAIFYILGKTIKNTPLISIKKALTTFSI
ncbi:hypothetical protein DOT_6291 [Desulfosporosinus sp. OT]|nr:hypothetical protein DOT_6291 [Desulfosporosinus sp. OT]